jgi:hypothetical protein
MEATCSSESSIDLQRVLWEIVKVSFGLCHKGMKLRQREIRLTGGYAHTMWTLSSVLYLAMLYGNYNSYFDSPSRLSRDKYITPSDILKDNLYKNGSPLTTKRRNNRFQMNDWLSTCYVKFWIYRKCLRNEVDRWMSLLLDQALRRRERIREFRISREQNAKCALPLCIPFLLAQLCTNSVFKQKLAWKGLELSFHFCCWQWASSKCQLHKGTTVNTQLKKRTLIASKQHWQSLQLVVEREWRTAAVYVFTQQICLT